jgi:hypothetical protein
MQTDPQHGRSELFLVRIWEKRESNSPSDGPTEWYGTVQHTVSGRTRSFKGWDGLNATLLELLQTIIHVHGKRKRS